MKKKILVLLSIIIIFLIFYNFSNGFDFIKYSDKDFNITTYLSANDKDGDGINDQNDILISAKEYIKLKPVYKSKYYSSGYPDDKFGVCTDVLAFALLNSGYDFQEMVNNDIINHPKDYPNIINIDKNIDFRRVRNLIIFFENNYTNLTIEESDFTLWQAGDIVVIKKHVGIVSDIRNKNGIPYLIHNNGNGNYNENCMNRYNIVGHYRLDLKIDRT
jgi:uncharacterized protein YijF (DUF1287 family)